MHGSHQMGRCIALATCVVGAKVQVPITLVDAAPGIMWAARGNPQRHRPEGCAQSLIRIGLGRLVWLVRYFCTSSSLVEHNAGRLDGKLCDQHSQSLDHLERSHAVIFHSTGPGVSLHCLKNAFCCWAFENSLLQSFHAQRRCCVQATIPPQQRHCCVRLGSVRFCSKEPWPRESKQPPASTVHSIEHASDAG